MPSLQEEKQGTREGRGAGTGRSYSRPDCSDVKNRNLLKLTLKKKAAK